MDHWDQQFSRLNIQTKETLRRIEATFGQAGIQEVMQMGWKDEADEVIITEPILAKKDCQVRIDFAEPTEWTVKETVPGHAGEKYKAVKLTITITDEDIKTEHENSRPRLVIEHQFNVEKYPYLDKKSGTVKWLGRQGVYDLEEAFGFEPIFTNGNGEPVEAFVTRTGRKVAPKGDSIKRKLNPDFASTYFQEDGTVKPEAWIDKATYADIGVETSEQYGDKNRITRFKAAPVTV